MLKNIYRALIELTNHRASSLLVQKFATSRISALLIPSYAQIFKINQDEMEKSLRSYPTLHDLFIRTLKEEARPIDESTSSLVSPVDAKVEECGRILPSKEIIVKNKRYSIQEMVGNDEVLHKYIDGEFVILYLSPKDYHRIHSPISGSIVQTWTLGNKSYPVNQAGLKYGKDPLIKNYRQLTEVQHSSGHVLMVKVGAMFINSIERMHESNQLIKGQEMAYFTFGSTVILLFEKDTIQLSSHIKQDQLVKVGERIGTLSL
ncbi:phosphatidylserine decarboxylase [Metabacillus iocasae]|uniref:Phosphatidylserine decarboxylase proenzyme n=1 Tax=Priestia iocasae TaxID=2291674 RepID=A0ABS2QPR1_9BACI|nr:phosphatidylserine decarboxylase [Metabacillus iocasae]MBM7701445.1 phosphatidylserine decarboxylase [Metabacillus iocasae]